MGMVPFDSEVEAQATYVAVSSDYKEEVRGAHLVNPKGVVQQLMYHDICKHQKKLIGKSRQVTGAAFIPPPQVRVGV